MAKLSFIGAAVASTSIPTLHCPLSLRLPLAASQSPLVGFRKVSPCDRSQLSLSFDLPRKSHLFQVIHVFLSQQGWHNTELRSRPVLTSARHSVNRCESKPRVQLAILSNSLKPRRDGYPSGTGDVNLTTSEALRGYHSATDVQNLVEVAVEVIPAERIFTSVAAILALIPSENDCGTIKSVRSPMLRPEQNNQRVFRAIEGKPGSRGGLKETCDFFIWNVWMTFGNDVEIRRSPVQKTAEML